MCSEKFLLPLSFAWSMTDIVYLEFCLENLKGRFIPFVYVYFELMLKRKFNNINLAQKVKSINDIEVNPQCKKRDVALKIELI